MIELLSSPAALWCIAAFALFALEAFMPSFIFMFFGIAALVTSALTGLGVLPGIGSQSVVFALGSVAAIITLRKYARSFFVGTQRDGSDKLDDEFIGKLVKVTTAISPSTIGRVELKGAGWNAVSQESFAIGETARVTQRDGINLTVEKS